MTGIQGPPPVRSSSLSRGQRLKMSVALSFMSKEFKVRLAAQTTDQNILTSLAGSVYSEVRERVARNYYTPGAILLKLSNDSKEGVKAAVRDNPRIKLARETAKPNFLTTLANSAFWMIREEVARNQNTPEEILGNLVNNDPDKRVKEAVADNPKIKAYLAEALNTHDPKRLTEMAGLRFPCVRRQVAGNLSTPPVVLKSLAEGEAPWGVKVTAALNPKTPGDAVGFVLSQFKESYEFIEYNPDVKAGIFCPRAGDGDWGYVIDDKDVETAIGILKNHPMDKEKILASLQQSKPTLYSALCRS